MYNSFITLHKVKKQTIRYLLKNARGPKFFLNVCTQLWQVPTDEQTSVPEAIMKRNHHLILPLEKKKIIQLLFLQQALVCSLRYIIYILTVYTKANGSCYLKK